jgi:hypothetical protein
MLFRDITLVNVDSSEEISSGAGVKLQPPLLNQCSVSLQSNCLREIADSTG